MLPRDPLAWMWIEACETLYRAEKLQRQLFRLRRLSQRCPSWEPPADMFETETALKVVVLLPGVTPDRIAASIEGGLLTVIGERQLPRFGLATIHRLEIPHGRFEKRIRLPSEGYEITDSEFEQGCLVISLSKRC